MIKKLRIKFILMSMSSLFLVLLFILGSINIINYNNIIKNADDILEVLADNDGTFPKGEEIIKNKTFKSMSPEVPYESRFFSVLIDSDGNVTSVDTGRIAAIDSDTAVRYASEIFQQNKIRGMIGNYRYFQKSINSGSRIIFVDCGRSLANFRTFLVASGAISLAGMIMVLLLIIFFSKKIVKPISESYEKQKCFITDAGHEIKTPLAIINADAEVLMAECEDNEWLEDILKQTNRLSVLTNDLIYLSRMEENENKIQLIDFPLSDVIEETALSFSAPAKVSGKTYFCDIQPGLTIMGDEKELRQLTGILLDNAIKYSDENGKIHISLHKQGRFIILTIENTTHSITSEEINHLFDRFYRIDHSRNSKTGGYGLGLSIAKAIVLSHEGKIYASSRDGKSLTISASIPCR